MVLLVDSVICDLAERAARIRQTVASCLGNRRPSDNHSPNHHHHDQRPRATDTPHGHAPPRRRPSKQQQASSNQDVLSSVDVRLRDAQQVFATVIRTELCNKLCDDVKRIGMLEQTRLRQEVVRVARGVREGNGNGNGNEIFVGGRRGGGGGRMSVMEIIERRVSEIDRMMETVRRMRFVEGLEQVRVRYCDMLSGIRKRNRANGEMLMMMGRMVAMPIMREEERAWRWIEGIEGDIGPVTREMESGEGEVRDAEAFVDPFP